MVKPRTLVLGLREYYVERHKSAGSVEHQALKDISEIVSSSENSDQAKVQEVAKVTHIVACQAPEDEWALEYITMSRIQPLLEAFDDDASSLVSIAEVNAFTRSRPQDWSLPKWLAYWAAGYSLILNYYFRRIQILLARISVLAHEARTSFPGNNIIIDYFMNTGPATISLDFLLAGIHLGLSQLPAWDQYLFDRFKSYSDSEESRILKKLESVKYLIDTDDTLRFIIGTDRLERHLLPLVYLLLRRAWHALRHARSTALHPQELVNLADSLRTILYAAHSRAAHLIAMFELHNLDPKEQLRKFSYGLYYYSTYNMDKDVINSSEYLSTIYLRSKFGDTGYNIFVHRGISFLWRHLSACRTIDYPDLDFVQETEPLEPLLYPSQDLDPHVEIYDSDNVLQDFSPDDHSMAWTGSCSAKLYDGGYSSDFPAGIFYLAFPPVGEDGPITGSGTSGQGASTITGTLRGFAVKLDRKNTSGTIRLSGTLNEARDIIEGIYRKVYPSNFKSPDAKGANPSNSAGSSGHADDSSCDAEDSSDHLGRFKLHVAPAWFSHLKLAPEELTANKARALWRFAIGNILNLVRIRAGHFTWSYLKERRRIRQRFVELFNKLDTEALPILAQFSPGLLPNESDELAVLASICSKQDLQLYQKLSLILRRRQSFHWGIWCANCHGRMVPTRYLCLDCLRFDKARTPNEALTQALDFCSNCSRKELIRATPSEANHLDTHSLFEIRIPYQAREEWDRTLHVRRLLDEARASGTAKSRACHYCQSTLDAPYWYCVDCSGNICVCMQCKVEKDDAMAHEDVVSYASYAAAMLAGRPEAVGDAGERGASAQDPVHGDAKSSGAAASASSEAAPSAEPAPAGRVAGQGQVGDVSGGTSGEDLTSTEIAADGLKRSDDAGTSEEHVVHSFKHEFILYQPSPASPASSDPVKEMFVELRDRLQRLEDLIGRLVGGTQPGTTTVATGNAESK